MRVSGLYAITDRAITNGRDVEAAEQALEAGCRIIQYREKGLPYGEMLGKAKKIKELCRQHSAFFFVNDHVELAKDVGADGLHLGQEDERLEEARKEFSGIIGVSALTYKEAMGAQQADYIGAGPVFATKTKADARPACGVAELKRIVEHSAKPVIAIGGITLENVAEVMDTKVAGVAVISAIMKGDVFYNTRNFLDAMKGFEKGTEGKEKA